MRKNIAIINGASGGIGSAIAKTLAQDHYLVLIGRNKDKLKLLISDLPKSHLGSEYHVVDFQDIDLVKEFAKNLETYRWKITALVNSVGIVPFGGIEKVDELDWEKSIQISLMSAVRLVKYFSPLMRNQGSIVLVNGIFAIQPDPDFIIASTITGALRNFSKALSKDLIKKSIRVNSVLPGATDTPLWDEITKAIGNELDISHEVIKKNTASDNPMKRIASPIDVADAVKFLISDSAAYINGATLTIDGGISVSN